MVDISTMYAKDGELEKLQQSLKRTVSLCKVIWQYRYYIEEIKGYIKREELTGASEEWNDLQLEVQKLLIIAPSKGSPFTTKERAIIREFWNISAEEYEK